MRRSRSMPATIRLLGPDLGNSPLLVEVEPTDTIEILKKHTLEKWPAGARAPPPPSVASRAARAIFCASPEPHGALWLSPSQAWISRRLRNCESFSRGASWLIIRA